MRYTVDWDEHAAVQLARIWTNSQKRADVTAAVERTEYQLTYRPLLVGESRETTLVRVVFETPITVLLEVIEDDKKVVVRAVFAT